MKPPKDPKELEWEILTMLDEIDNELNWWREKERHDRECFD